MGIVEAMQERCFGDFTEILTVSDTEYTQLFVNGWIEMHGYARLIGCKHTYHVVTTLVSVLSNKSTCQLVYKST